jgi:uncharacterized protein YbjT (DUF2867 family)
MRLGFRDPALAQAAEAIRFDFEDAATYPAALAGATGVFLLRPPALTRAQAFRPFLESARAAGVRHVIFLSVRGAERTRLLPHHGIERLVEASGMPFTHLRPNDFMQNFATVHREDIRDRGELFVPAGRGRASYVDVRDIGEAAAVVLADPGAHAGRGYTLTGPEALSVDDVARILTDALGHPIAYRAPGLARFVAGKVRRGAPLSLALVMSTVYTIQRLGFAAEVTSDLPRLIGRPATAFARFAADHRAVWTPGADR